MTALAEAAARYARHGWAVLPIAPGERKQPFTRLAPHGLHDATTDPAMIRRWWSRAPGANVAVACALSGLVVIDVDPRHGGDDTMHALERDLGPLAPTVEALTGGGGRHLYFRDPGGPLAGQLGPGIDVKHRGYVVAPPSRHATGRSYEWSVDGHADDLGPADLPSPWLDRARIPARGDDPATGGDGAAGEHDDPLLDVPAHVYIAAISGRLPDRRAYVRCPLHANGQERTPSLKLYGTSWTCFGCPAPVGRDALGGTIYTFAALDWGYPLPLRGPAFLRVRDRLHDAILDHLETEWAAA